MGVDPGYPEERSQHQHRQLQHHTYMTDNLIHRSIQLDQHSYLRRMDCNSRADALREIPVIQRRRITITRDTCIMTNLVQFIGRNSRPDMRCSKLENLACELEACDQIWKGAKMQKQFTLQTLRIPSISSALSVFTLFEPLISSNDSPRAVTGIRHI